MPNSDWKPGDELTQTIKDYLETCYQNIRRGLSKKVELQPEGFKKITMYKVGDIVRIDLQPESDKGGE